MLVWRFLFCLVVSWLRILRWVIVLRLLWFRFSLRLSLFVLLGSFSRRVSFRVLCCSRWLSFRCLLSSRECLCFGLWLWCLMCLSLGSRFRLGCVWPEMSRTYVLVILRRFLLRRSVIWMSSRIRGLPCLLCLMSVMRSRLIRWSLSLCSC